MRFCITTLDRRYPAKLIDLPLNALGLLLSFSANPLIEGVEDTDHPVKWDGDEELVFGKARQSSGPEIEE